MTHSFSGKALAVKRVTENRGKKTPGVDGEIWDTPAKKANALKSLKRWGYRPRPLRRVFIKVKGEDGKARFVKLVQTSDTPIRRHIKIKGEANPFDPAWETYFEKRLSLFMKDSLKGQRRLLHLWRIQNGRCPNCHEPITKTTGWHVHHILPKAQGGMDNLANLVLLHPNCHQQVHGLIQREQPAPVKGGFAEA